MDEAIDTLDEKALKKVLINAPFKIVLGNYLETTKFTVDTRSYGLNLSNIIQMKKLKLKYDFEPRFAET